MFYVKILLWVLLGALLAYLIKDKKGLGFNLYPMTTKYGEQNVQVIC